jgi:serine/threonine protein kinase
VNPGARPDTEPLPPSVERLLDQACDRFEADWLQGRRPRIEDHLAAASEPERTPLLHELILLEIYYRRCGGEEPRPADYAERFPTLDPAWETAALAAPSPPQAAPALPAVPGYEVLGELGRGGMGVVYRARQVKLNWLVALKMIRAGEHARPEDLARFRREAEAVARLQHPHIVQIYEVGEHGGLPYFSLELVDGGSLARRLNGLPQPPPEAAHLVETLARAVHYAHQRGVVHRDLKPANILLQKDLTQRRKGAKEDKREENEGREEASAGALLPPPSPSLSSSSLGAFAPLREVTPKITDFGLAKRPGAELGQTQSGAVVGTPSYMAPEQAAGASREVGPAADVYALGAILYELLTGRPPFQGATVLDTLDQVRSQEPVPPGRLQPKVPRDLETVCLKCLRKEPARRYADALELADDLGRFRAGEPVRARPVSAWEQAVKWARRRPALAALTAVSFLSALALTLGSLWYSAELKAALEQARREQGEKERQRDRAVAYAAKARRAVRRMLTRVGAQDLADVPHMDEQRRRLLEDALEILQEFLHDRDNTDPRVRQDAGLAFQDAALIYGLLGRPAEAEKAHRSALALLEALAAEFPDDPEHRGDLASAYGNWTHWLRDNGRPVEAEAICVKNLAIFRQLAREQPDDLACQRNLCNTLNTLADFYGSRGKSDLAGQTLRESLALGQALINQHPSLAELQAVQAACRTNLARWCLHDGRVGPAEAELQAAVTCQERLTRLHPAVAEFRHDLGHTYATLGRVYAATGRTGPGDSAFAKALALQEQLVKDHPKVLAYQLRLALTCCELGGHRRTAGRLTAAEEVLRKGLDLAEGMARVSPRTAGYREVWAKTLHQLGLLYHRTGREGDADQAYRQAAALAEALSRDHPTRVGYRFRLADCRADRGCLLLSRKQWDGADESFRQARDILEPLTRDFPQAGEFRLRLATVLVYQGVVHRTRGRTPEAVAALEKAAQALEPLAREHPTKLNYQEALVAVYDELGLCHQPGDPERARRYHQQALDLAGGLADAHPERADLAVLAAVTCCHVGLLFYQRGKPEDALAWFDRARDRLEPVVQREKGEVQAVRALAYAHRSRSGALTRLGRHAEAVRALDRAVALVDGAARDLLRCHRAFALARLGDHARATAEAADLAGQASLSAGNLFTLVGVQAQAVTAVLRDPQLGEEERKRLAEQYAARAVRWLKRARATGQLHLPLALGSLRADAEFAPLRGRADFQQVLAELEKEVGRK